MFSVCREKHYSEAKKFRAKQAHMRLRSSLHTEARDTGGRTVSKSAHNLDCTSAPRIATLSGFVGIEGNGYMGMDRCP